jgi:hypothetical protein
MISRMISRMISGMISGVDAPQAPKEIAISQAISQAPSQGLLRWRRLRAREQRAERAQQRHILRRSARGPSHHSAIVVNKAQIFEKADAAWRVQHGGDLGRREDARCLGRVQGSTDGRQEHAQSGAGHLEAACRADEVWQRDCREPLQPIRNAGRGQRVASEKCLAHGRGYASGSRSRRRGNAQARDEAHGCIARRLAEHAVAVENGIAIAAAVAAPSAQWAMRCV